jgi:hypothetical protein
MQLRAPIAKGPALQLSAQHFIPLPFNNNFDNYFDGPSLEDMNWLSRTQDGAFYIVAQGHAQKSTRSPWELFKDYGYRLEPSFALMFNKSQPYFAAEHMIPIGDVEPKNPPSHWDIQVLSMSDLLQDAGGIGSETSMKMFVKGLTEDGDYIYVDLELDHTPLSSNEVICSIDIDSIIWVTHLLKVKTQIMVHVLSYSGKAPPISRNNHVFVELLIPQSEMDQFNDGSQTEWFSTCHSLSTIPHSHFAKASLYHHMSHLQDANDT